MKPEHMNTINENGKAYNGNRNAVVIALLFVIAVAMTACVKALF